MTDARRMLEVTAKRPFISKTLPATGVIEAIGRVNMDYMVRLANDPAWAEQELCAVNAYCADKGAYYGDQPVPVPIKPHFISAGQRRLLEGALQNLHSALEKFIHLWLASEELQAMWNVSPEEMDLYRVDPGTRHSIQVARFDAFLQDEDLQFLEFNCDSPGGTGYADVIHEAFLDMFDRNDMSGDYHVSSRQRLLHLAETLDSCYREWRAQHPDRPQKPFIVVSDWRDVDSRPDIDITLRHLVDAGADAVFSDPRDMEHRADGLYVDGRRVDLVYKRVIVKELVEDPDAQALTAAYKAGQVCMVNSPRSVIPGNKKILAALRRPDVLKRLNTNERAAVRKHVPWTEVLRDDKVEFQGFLVNLRDFVLDNKDQLVLKAAQSYGGRDVFLGFETDAGAWRDLVDQHIAGGAWIVQRFVPIPKELYPEVVDGQVHMNLMNVNINPLAFGGRYAGSYTRLSKKNVINVSFGGGMTCTMTIEPRDGLL